MQLGDRPFRAVKVISKILKLILKLTSSQCKSERMSVMCSHFLVPVKILVVDRFTAAD